MRIGFGELDYSSIESDGMATVLLTLSDPITMSLTVPVIAVSFADFFGSGKNLTDHFDDIELPDPAECMKLVCLLVVVVVAVVVVVVVVFSQINVIMSFFFVDSADPNERSDFIISDPILVTFPPSIENQAQEVSIPLVQEDINEATEGFFVMVISENISDPTLAVDLVRGGVTLVRISNDDCKPA